LQTIGQHAAPDNAATPAKEQPTQTEVDAEVKGAAASDPRSPATQTESGEDGQSHDKGENASSHSRHAAGESPAKTELAAPPQRLGDVPVIVKTGADAMPNLGAWAPASQASAVTAAMNVSANVTATSTVPIAGLAVEIATQAQAGNHRFEIRLDPPELGRIDVRLDIDRDGNVTTRLVADRSDTLDLLKRDSTQLERALQHAGLKTSDNALEFSLRQQGFARDETASQNSARLIIPDDELAPLDAQVQGYGRLLGRGNGLDIRV